MIFSQEEFNSRISKVKESMNKKGIEILLTTDPSNMNYLTGYDGWSFYVPQGVILSIDEEQPYWFGRKQDSNGARITTYLNEKNIFGYPEHLIQSPPSHPYDFIVKLFKDKKWSGKNIGVEMDSYYYTAENHKRLIDNLTNAKFINAHLLINWVRYIKSENEIRYMKDAGMLVKAGMQTAFDSIKEGVKQSAVAGKIQNTLIAGNKETQMGGEYAGLGLILASGRSASASHLTPSEKKFENNEGTIIELGGVKHRYHCALSRTVYVGKPDSKISDTLKVTNEGIERALEQTKPGNTCHDVAVAFWSVLEKYGLKKESRAGYSIGLGYPPDWGEHTLSIRKKEKTLLEPNVTYHLMCGMWMDTWGLELSESVRVTNTGYELLTHVPRDLHVVN